jgi:hypothetical protein
MSVTCPVLQNTLGTNNVSIFFFVVNPKHYVSFDSDFDGL